jgi:hypothetical protein
MTRLPRAAARRPAEALGLAEPRKPATTPGPAAAQELPRTPGSMRVRIKDPPVPHGPRHFELPAGRPITPPRGICVSSMTASAPRAPRSIHVTPLVPFSHPRPPRLRLSSQPRRPRWVPPRRGARQPGPPRHPRRPCQIRSSRGARQTCLPRRVRLQHRTASRRRNGVLRFRAPALRGVPELLLGQGGSQSLHRRSSTMSRSWQRFRTQGVFL